MRTRAVAALLLAAAAGLACAARAADGAGLRTIANCVGGAPLALRAVEPRVLLDAGDRAMLRAAMLQRYPVLARDGFEPADILLWRGTAGHWAYVALQSDTRRPGGRCVAASFAAAAFAITPALLQKYFFQPGSRT